MIFRPLCLLLLCAATSAIAQPGFPHLNGAFPGHGELKVDFVANRLFNDDPLPVSATLTLATEINRHNHGHRTTGTLELWRGHGRHGRPDGVIDLTWNDGGVARIETPRPFLTDPTAYQGRVAWNGVLLPHHPLEGEGVVLKGSRFRSILADQSGIPVFTITVRNHKIHLHAIIAYDDSINPGVVAASHLDLDFDRP